MDYREIIGLIVLFVGTIILAIKMYEEVLLGRVCHGTKLAGYAVAFSIAAATTLVAIIFEAKKFANHIGDAAYAAGREAAEKNSK